MPDITNELLTNEVEVTPAKKSKSKLTKEQLDALLSTMYSRPLTESEVDNLLANTTQLTVAYHSTYGGLDIVDPDVPMTQHGSHILISFAGHGNITTIETQTFANIFANHPLAKQEILQLFTSGLLTLEAGSIKSELYAKYYKTQPNKSLNNTNMRTDDGSVMKNDFIIG